MQVIGFLLKHDKMRVLQAKHDARAYPAAIIAAGEAIVIDHKV